MGKCDCRDGGFHEDLNRVARIREVREPTCEELRAGSGPRGAETPDSAVSLLGSGELKPGGCCRDEELSA